MAEKEGTRISLKKPTFHRKTPSSPELIEIGIIGCTPGYSHISEIYGPQINPVSDKDNTFIRATGMRMTMVWDADEKIAGNFAGKYDVKPVKSYTDMIGRVDAVMLTDIATIPYFYQLSKPYLEAPRLRLPSCRKTGPLPGLGKIGERDYLTDRKLVRNI